MNDASFVLGEKRKKPRRSVNWGGYILILSLLLIVLFAAPGAGKEGNLANVQPALLQMAQEQPQEAVSVIVQKVGEADVEAMVPQLGGVVTRDLRIINAFAAELPAASVAELARADGVQWVSLNAPMISSQADGAITFTSWSTERPARGPDVTFREDDFKDEPIQAGRDIWFNSVIKVNGRDKIPSTFYYYDGVVRFSANGVDYELPVPDATVTFSAGATMAGTTFDEERNTWLTVVPTAYDKEVFLSGFVFPVPEDFLERIDSVTWSGRFTTDQPQLDADVDFKWAAAVYPQAQMPYNDLGVKPLDGDQLNPYPNGDKAGTPEQIKQGVLKGARGNGSPNYTGDFTGAQRAVWSFNHPGAITGSPLGPDGVYGMGSQAFGSFAGFDIEVTPGYAISRVEAVLPLYAAGSVSSDVKLKVYFGDVRDGGEYKIAKEVFSSYVGAQNAGVLYLDLTALRGWQWSDFSNGLSLVIEQNGIKPEEAIYYDAAGLRITSMPSQTVEQLVNPDVKLPKEAIDVAQMAGVWPWVVRAPQVWNEGPAYVQGHDIVVAVVDSGIGKNKDLKGRQQINVNFNSGYHDSKDKYGHGTFVASLIAGDGHHSKGAFIGAAPQAILLNVRVSDDQGLATEADVVAALQWIYENREAYNIRVVNLSLNSAVPQSYHESPLSAAVEILWFNDIVVVVSAGNNRDDLDNGGLLPPANDPYVITVGATDDRGTADLSDDVLSPFSAYGLTANGYAKPDIVAPGTDIIAYLPHNGKLKVGQQHPTHSVDADYFRMSGTSFSAPIVSGAVAMLLQDEPNLTPDQVKYRLMATAAPFVGPEAGSAGAGYLDVYAAVHGTTSERANLEAMPHRLLARMALMAYWASNNDGGTTDWDQLDWSSVNWASVDWENVDWTSVNWASVNWASVNWASVNWASVNWASVNWASVNWASVNWASVNWASVNWASVNWASVNWDQ